MTFFSCVPFVAAIFSLLLALASVMRTTRSPATWCFFAGMAMLALDSVFTGLSLLATALPDVSRWLTFGLIVKCFLPIAWLAFSLTYSRGDGRESLTRWTIPLAVTALLPLGLYVGPSGHLIELRQGTASDMVGLRFSAVGKGLSAILLVALVPVLVNLEQTLRTAVGTMRWRVKFVVLGLAVIFGAHIYVRSEIVLFGAPGAALSSVESSALLVGCFLLAVAYLRDGFARIDLYPSRAVLRSSLTVLIVGAYLLSVGVLAQFARRFGGAEAFQLQVFIVLLALAGLAVLILSDRLRQRVHSFVGRHFRGAQHDSTRIWAELSRRLAAVTNETGLCTASSTLVSETFDVLSVTVWLLGDQAGQLVIAASTAGPVSGASDGGIRHTVLGGAALAALSATPSPLDLETVNAPWAEQLRQVSPATFGNGGDRWCVPLAAGGRLIGVLVLADRVNGAQYTAEERDLLRSIANQVTSALLNMRLADEVARARELEAFRTMSAFFVHDLKNAAASLNLMLKNLPVHFDQPAFREDALRGVANTARRIDDMIGRLSALRQRPDLRPIDADLNELVTEALDRLDGTPHACLTRALGTLPRVLVDPEQIHSVVTNLVLNAREAVGPGGRIEVRTDHRDGRVVLSVADDGCGMSEAFLRESLFRPFQSTKKKGFGIGMFQARMIVEAHGGRIQVESEPGKGTTVRVSLPATNTK